MSLAPTGQIIYFDGTTSGYQLLGLGSNDKVTMEATNVIPSYDDHGIARRRDFYMETTETMYDFVDKKKSILLDDKKLRRKQVKKPGMTVAYGSKKQPEDLFGVDTQDLAAFYQAIEIMADGPLRLLDDIQASWNPYALEHGWTMSNGTEVVIKTLQTEELTVSMTIDGKPVQLPYRHIVNKGQRKGISLGANGTHSVDALVKDYVVLDFKKSGRYIVTIHDAFGVHPNDVPFLMDSYRNALLRVYQDREFDRIIRQLRKDPSYSFYRKDTTDYSSQILQSVYALS